MGIEDFNNETAGFEDFAEADLLDLVEGAMTHERAKELAEAIKSRHPELLGQLTRMQADRLALSSHKNVAPPQDLISNVMSQPSDGSFLDQDFQEAVEPTQMMERAVKDLGRRRRRRKQAPLFAAIAAGIAGIGVTTSIMIIIDAASSDESVNLAQTTSAPLNTPVESLNVIPEKQSEAIVAEYGLVLRGVDEGSLGSQLANLLAYGDTVVVENLTLDDSVRNRTGGSDKLRAAIQAGNKTIIHNSEMLPPPLVGSLEQAPSAEVRLDLADRGFQYAIVVDCAKAADAIAQIGKLADSAGLVPAHVEPNDKKFVLDAWKDWQSRAEATAVGQGSQQRLIVPISCGDAKFQR